MNGNLFELLRSRYAPSMSSPFLSPPDGPPLSYGELDELSARLTTVLRLRGVTPGERVVVQVPKSTEAVALYLACLRAGAIYVPINPAYAAGEVQYFLDDARPRLFVDAESVHDTGVDPPEESASIDSLAVEASATEPAFGVAVRMADDVAAILYTSGTTGRPKGAMLTHANLTSNALTLHKSWRYRPGDILLHVLPIFHVHGLFVALHTAMLNSSEVVFLDRFDADAVVDQLPRISVMMGVPTHYTRLLGHDGLDADTCRAIRLFTSGSAPMTKSVHEEFAQRTGHTILERYGMTEAGMITSNPYDGERRAGTVGFPLPGVELRTRTTDGRLGEPGETGVVEIRSPGLFAGYWQLPDATEEAHTPDGFFVTGDVGTVDADGRLTLEGRTSDMIISGGLNIYPRELEQHLDAIDGVIESAVVGVPDEDLGETVVAVLVVDEKRFDVSTVDAYLESAVARFKRPRRYVVVDSLPRNTMGKIRKAELRTMVDSDH